jgi:chaperonin GroES
MNIKPMNDMICVEPVEVESTTPGGIVLPGTVVDAPVKGKVLAVGPGTVTDNGNTRPIRVNVGDTILFVKATGVPFEIERGNEVLFLKEAHIVAVVN